MRTHRENKQRDTDEMNERKKKFWIGTVHASPQVYSFWQRRLSNPRTQQAQAENLDVAAVKGDLLY